MKIDIVIPVGFKDIHFIHKVVEYIFRCIKDVENIYLLTNKKNFKSINKYLHQHKKIYLIDENNLIDGLTFSNIGHLLKKHKEDISIGWYYQQFLKFAFGISKYADKPYLTWDADTLPIAPLSFYEGEHPLFTIKTEYNPNYFVTIERLLNIKKKNNFSYIAEHMVFIPQIVSRMLKDIEKSNISGNHWFEKIINAGDYSTTLPTFSEFETYGTYINTYYPELYHLRHLNTFRHGGLLRGRWVSDKLLRKLSFDVDTISFEITDMPLFPYNIPNIYILTRQRISKIKHYSFKLLLIKIKQRLSNKKGNEEILKLMDRMNQTNYNKEK